MKERIKFLTKTFIQAYIAITITFFLALYVLNINFSDIWFIIVLPVFALIVVIPIHLYEHKKEIKEKMNMNVYKVNERYIAAKNADTALSHYVEETCYPENLFFGMMDEGEEDTCEIKIKRLTSKEIEFTFITCCMDGCDECDGRDEPVLYSPIEVVNKTTEFPRTICVEEY